MVAEQADASVLCLAEGFNALMDEYNHLLARSQSLEQSLVEVKAQFQHFVSERGTVSPADLKDFELSKVPQDIENPLRRIPSTAKWWMRTDLPMSKRGLLRTRYAVDAIHRMNLEKAGTEDAVSKISSEFVANGGSSAMPSIVESPLEQDFTIPGTPSQLDCPFASMASRRLSAHAASVVSKYKPNGVMTPRSAMSRVSGRSHTQRLAAPIDNAVGHSIASPAKTSPDLQSPDLEASIQGSGPVCPIRFLEKKSPEEVAEYFEKHKHELPRSHEICVRRFGDTAATRQLDAKYGDLVSMIQGLGQKHAPMLPGKDENGEDVAFEPESEDRVRKWADNISNAAQVEEPSTEEEERVSHFDRPMKDVRVGESPSRPWGIQVPISALEKAEAKEVGKKEVVETAKPAGQCPFAHGAPPGMVNPHLTEATPAVNIAQQPAAGKTETVETPKPAGKCPFANGTPAGMVNPHVSAEKQATSTAPQHAKAIGPDYVSGDPPAVFIAGAEGLPKTTFTGPVFIGYSPEQAAAVLLALRDK